MKIKEVENKNHKFGEPDRYFVLQDEDIEIQLLDGTILKFLAPGMVFTQNDLETIGKRALKNQEDIPQNKQNWFERLFNII